MCSFSIHNKCTFALLFSARFQGAQQVPDVQPDRQQREPLADLPQQPDRQQGEPVADLPQQPDRQRGEPHQERHRRGGRRGNGHLGPRIPYNLRNVQQRQINFRYGQ